VVVDRDRAECRLSRAAARLIRASTAAEPAAERRHGSRSRADSATVRAYTAGHEPAHPHSAAAVTIVLQTERLLLRHLTEDDAEFYVTLVNDPDWLRFIGDRGLRTAEAAREYLASGPIPGYARNGFGLYLTALKEGGTPIGICGLVRREGLDDVDVGFAFLPAFRGRGYAVEAGTAVLAHAHEDVGLTRVAAITNPDNDASIAVLHKLGFRFDRLMRLSPDAAEVNLFLRELLRPPLG
jgi:RimJ/RimL family protein N-acetyltransferase